MRKTFLMCEPKFYGVEYVINPHMQGNVGKVDKELALKQWNNLHSILSEVAQVLLIDQAPGLPDMVFTANAGMVIRDLHYVWLSRFAVPERRSEERLFAGWFIAEGFDILQHDPVSQDYFEGAGDGLVDAKNEYWLGYGMRTSRHAVEAIAKLFNNRTFHLLELTDPHFYHLDTCFAPLSKGHYLWYPRAFTTPSYWYVAMRNGRSSGIANPDNTTPDMLIDVDEADAMQFACNSICVDDLVIMPRCSQSLVDRVKEHGYNVVNVDLSEFIKAGGAAQCLTLQIR